MNTAQYIVKKLEEFGVNEFFGVPGEYNLNLIYAVENNVNTKWIGCTNELNAGYAADGYARIRGYGALITNYGSGELSALNAIAGAMAENIALVHIVGLPSAELVNKNNLIHGNIHDVDYQNNINIYNTVTAASAILTADNAKLEIDRLLKIMVKEKRPVYIAIPEDIAQIEISDRELLYDWYSDSNVLTDVSEKIADKINQAKKPIIIGDVLIKRFDACIEFKEFVAKTGIPVTNFLMGTNLINMEAKNYIGGYFGKTVNYAVHKYLEESDCRIAVGTVCSDINTYGQKFEFDNNIAINGSYVYVDGVRYDNIKMSELLDAVTKLVEYRDIEFEKSNIGFEKQEIDKPLSSLYLYSRIQDFIKDNDIVITDFGTALFGTAQFKLPESANYEAQALWCSKGWATPAALGVGLAKPQSRLVVISGDCAHQHTAMEIGNMVENGLKPIIIVINNNGYTTGRYLSNTISDSFNDVTRMNYAKFARVFDGDIWATKVTTSEDFDKALRVTQIMNKLCYIEVGMDITDITQLSKDVLTIEKRNISNQKIPVTNVEKINNAIENVTLTVSDENFNYETVVHSAFKEDYTEGKEE